MKNRVTKRRTELLKKIEKNKDYSIQESITLLSSLKSVKFDETVEVSLRLNLDPRHADQMIRSSVILPNGIGKKIVVAALVKDDKIEDAKKAGADIIGNSELIESIKEGKIEFDTLITTPDMMGLLGKVARILGPKGLMPNPKVGTITTDIAKTVKEAKSGKVNFKIDKKGNIHAGIGKISFTSDKLVENFKTFVNKIIKLKPATAKGKYILNATVSLTMSPSVSINISEILKLK